MRVQKIPIEAARGVINSMKAANAKTGLNVKILCTLCKSPIEDENMYAILDDDGKEYAAAHPNCCKEKYDISLEEDSKFQDSAFGRYIKAD